MRIQQLDGLRTVAVLLVVLIHHGLFPSGWVGVDIFFVLSGYLITRILRRESCHPSYWKSFYVKRAARILPPMFVVTSTVFVFAGHFRPIYLGYLFFASNLVQLTPAALDPLAAMWSLAIEEHFYFVWPLAVMKLKRYALLKLSLSIVLLSPLLRIIGTLLFRHLCGGHMGWDSPIFLLTPFRIDGLAAGAVLALLLEDGRRPVFLQRWSGVASCGAASLFVALEFFIRSFRRTTDSLPFNGLGYSLVVVFAFFLISFLLLNPDAILTRLLSSRSFVFLGTISYGLYLYQGIAMWVTRRFLGTSIPLKLLFLPDCALTLALAYISFCFLERPIMGWANTWLSVQNVAEAREGVIQPTEAARS